MCGRHETDPEMGQEGIGMWACEGREIIFSGHDGVGVGVRCVWVGAMRQTQRWNETRRCRV